MSSKKKDYFLMILSRIFNITDKWTLQLSDRYCCFFEEWFARCKNAGHEYVSFALCTASPYVCIYCTMRRYTGANIKGERAVSRDQIATKRPTKQAPITFNLILTCAVNIFSLQKCSAIKCI